LLLWSEFDGIFAQELEIQSRKEAMQQQQNSEGSWASYGSSNVSVSQQHQHQNGYGNDIHKVRLKVELS
jgi:hypothetical protein